MRGATLAHELAERPGRSPPDGVRTLFTGLQSSGGRVIEGFVSICYAIAIDFGVLSDGGKWSDYRELVYGLDLVGFEPDAGETKRP